MVLPEAIKDYTIKEKIGSGKAGSVYLANRPRKPTGIETVAIKYPANQHEIRTLEALCHCGKKPCLGVPVVYEAGDFEGEPWLAMELLGPPLTASWRALWACQSMPQRWAGVSVVGRLLLRRLWTIHKRGYVHGDLKPDNILVGRRNGGTAQERCKPFLVDFGLARTFPDGRPLPGHAATIEFSSIRSMDGGSRLPQDDVEALGWIMVYGMVSDLPWFEWIQAVDWSEREERAELVARIQKAKLDMLDQGFESLERRYPGLPTELCQFLRLSRAASEAGWGDADGLDYDKLTVLLGGWSVGSEESEQDDLTTFQSFYENGVKGLTLPPQPADFFVGASWNAWKLEKMHRDPSKRGYFHLEASLPRGEGEFQIVRNEDWAKQVFHPKRSHQGWDGANPVVGPSSTDSQGQNWSVNERPGSTIRIDFFWAEVQGAWISWRKVGQDPVPAGFGGVIGGTRNSVGGEKRYFMVGTWDDWKQKREMTWDGTGYFLTLQLGLSGRESFQILEEGDWARKLHPDMKRANPHVPHSLQGPDKHGHGKNWSVGYHPKDHGSPGAQFVIRLLVRYGRCERVEWESLSAWAAARG